MRVRSSRRCRRGWAPSATTAMGGWISYRAAKAAVNQIVRTGARSNWRAPIPKRSALPCIRARSRPPFTAKYAGPPPDGRAGGGGGEPAARHRRADPGAHRLVLRLGRQGDPLVSRLVLVLGDQLSPICRRAAARPTRTATSSSWPRSRTRRAMSRIIPRRSRSSSPPCASSRRALREDGWHVRYTELDDTENAGSIVGELLRRAEAASARRGARHRTRRMAADREAATMPPLKVADAEDDRFLATPRGVRGLGEGAQGVADGVFLPRDAAQDRPSDGRRQPAGGKWNFDHDNRKPAPDAIEFGGPMQFTPDDTVEDVLDLVEARFPDNLRRSAPVPVRHRPGAGAAGAGSLHQGRAAEVRRLSRTRC